MDKKYLLNFVIFFVLVGLLVLSYHYWWGKTEEQLEQEEPPQFILEGVDEQGNPVEIEAEIIPEDELSENTASENGLEIEILEAGSGEQAKNGDTLLVHYTGALLDGAKFDSSLDRGQPFQFTLGAGQVIAGWDQGLLGMKVGEKRKLTIPPELGYGPSGAGSIPPNSTLVFEVELLDI